MFTVLILISILSTQSLASSTGVNSFTGDADGALNSGDTLHAYRSYLILESAKPQLFYKTALSGYLRSVFLLGTTSIIKKECDRFSELKEKNAAYKADYICGLEFIENGKASEALRYLMQINHTSSFYWPTQILLASGDLLNDSPAAALKRLSPNDEHLYKKFDLQNEFHITRARSLVGLGKDDEAIREYQLIMPSVPMYVDALSEMAHVFYKMKRYESAQTLIDVLKTNYEGSFRGVQKITVASNIYFEARYLESHVELDLQHMDNATSIFEQLSQENQKFYADARDDNDPEGLLKDIAEQSLKWSDKRDFPEKLKGQLELRKAWLPPKREFDIERELELLLAYSHEASRLKTYASDFKTPELSSYIQSIDSLRERSQAILLGDLRTSAKEIFQTLNSFSLKTKLGKLELTTVQKAQGTRSLDEVIEDYAAKIHQMNELSPP